MILAGDEVGHTAQGNNNCYSQDNFLSWVNWELTESELKHLNFVRRLIEIRRDQPALSRRQFFKNATHGDDVDEIYWLDSAGRQMTSEEWSSPDLHALGLVLLGHCSQIDDQGACIVGDNLLILMNGGTQMVPFVMPQKLQRFEILDRLFDTYSGETEIVPYNTAEPYLLQPRSMALFRHSVLK